MNLSHINPKGFLFGSILLMLLQQVSANTVDTKDDLFNMSLLQLLNVTVVSKQNESIASSPGVVSAYDARELEALGLRNLIDFIHFVPGIEINERLGELRTVQIRGLPGNSNQKVLFMLDGVPYWMPESGDIPLYGLPIQGIKRIEVIRGPGSVIYGANASAGVINIVSRDDSGFSLNAYISNDNLRNLSLYGSKTFQQGQWFSLAAEIQRDNGYQYDIENAFAVDPCFCFPETANGQLTRKVEHSSVLARFGFEGLTATVQAFIDEETGEMNETLVSPSNFRSKGILIGLNYLHAFENADLTLYSDWNRFYRDIYADNFLAGFFLDSNGGIIFENNGDRNVRFRNGLSINYRVNEHFSILSGTEYEERGTENKKFQDDNNGSVLSLVTQPPFNLPFELQDDNSILLVEAAQNDEKSLFSQGDYTVDKWRFVVGVRYVDNSMVGSEVSPRGSIVYSINDTESIKLLYSQGFNAPTFRQSAATDSFGLPLDNDIEAETIRTWDLAYTKTANQLHYVLNVFHIEAHDLIKNNENIDTIIKRNGAEIDMQYRDENLKVFSGLSYIHEGNGNGGDLDAEFASRWMLKLGLDYSFHSHGFSAALRSAGKRAGVKNYHIMNINYQYQISKQMTFFTSITNAFNDQVMHPNPALLNKIQVQANDGIGLQVGFRFDM
jgi:outer membrane cobalamin receptor